MIYTYICIKRNEKCFEMVKKKINMEIGCYSPKTCTNFSYFVYRCFYSRKENLSLSFEINIFPIALFKA